MVFPVVIYGCQSWTVKKAECQKTDAFELRYWRRVCKDTQLVHPKEYQSRVFIGRTNIEA